MEATLCFPMRNGEVLLAMKLKGIGAGYWNGFGGGIESGEAPEDAAIRELEEECGLIASRAALKKAGVVDFHNPRSDGTSFTCRVYVYLLDEWEGVPRESDEMKTPTWFPFEKLPQDKMLKADAAWLPPVLAGREINAEVWYGPGFKLLDIKL